MKLDTKAMKFACSSHGVPFKLNGKTVEISRKPFALGGSVCLRPGTGGSMLQSDSLKTVGELIPEDLRAQVMRTYSKVLRVKLTYCKTILTEVESL